jgi:filamentous hemagglutinin
MNQQTYRIIFNKARGCLMAVAETATSQGKGASGERGTRAVRYARPAVTRSLFGVGPLQLACWLFAGALGWSLPLTHTAQAQTVATRIVADANAPKPQQATVLTTGNGVVQVNIQTPSAAGVSRNTYTQFDVGSQGAVLNNSRTNVQSQLGGWVQGNPWLATGSARVILNEVNSTNPSQLQGYVEVAGQRAEVVIANPAGIAVNGGGFINASGVTLTTGTPVMNNGSLERYRVTGGSVNVEGQGLDTRTADYTAILTRAVQLNAGIWAKQLQVVTGANDITASSIGSDATVQSSAIAGKGSAPAYALDVSQLGGMYAGKITLIGTEAGLGVRNAGQILASSRPLTLTQEGWLANSGTLQATGGDVTVQTRGSIAQSGTIYSDQNVQLSSQASQTHSATVAALGHVNILASGTNADGSAAQIQANNKTLWAAGLQTDGQLTGQQNLTVQASGQLQTAGKVLATQNLLLQAASLDVSQSSQQASQLQLQASTGDLKATGAQLLASDQLRLQTPQSLITDGARVQATALQIQANSLSNVSGQLIQTGTADQTLALKGNLTNTAGVIQSAANKLNISAQSLDNTAGQLLHAGSGSFELTSQSQLLNNTQSSSQVPVTDGARIVSTGKLSITSGDLSNSGSIYAAKDLSTTASSLNNSGTLYAAGSQSLAVANALVSSGTIAAGKDLTVNAATYSATSTGVLAAGMAADGQLTGQGALTATTTGALQSAGQALASGQLSLSAASLDLSGKASQASVVGSTGADVSLSAASGSILTQHAQISTPGQLSITANSSATQKLDNTAGQISAAQLNIRTGQLDNSQGTIEQTATGTRTANIQTAGVIVNNGGRIVANAQDLTISAAGALSNRKGLIGHAGSGQLSLSTNSLDNTQGQIMGNGAATLSSIGPLTNADGLIAAQKDVQIRSADLINTASGASTTATGIQSQTGQLVMNVQAVTNTSNIFAAKNLSITASSVVNSGTLYAAGNQTLAVSNAISNSGTLAAGQSLTLTADSLSASSTSMLAAGMSADGKLTGVGALTAITTNTLQSAGQVLSTGSLMLTGASLDMSSTSANANAGANVTSVVGSTTGDVSLQAASGNILVKGARINTPGQLSITANSAATQKLDNTSGQLSGKQLQIQVGQLDNTQGVIQQTGTGVQTARLQTAGAVNNTEGLILANAQNFTLNAGGALNNTDGQIGHAGTGAMNLNTAAIDNTRGTLLGNTALVINATGDVNNTSGLVAAQNVNIHAQGWNNSQGKLVSTQGDLSLNTSQNAVTNTSGLIQSAQDLRLMAEGTANALQNSQGKIMAARDASLSTGAITNTAGLIAAGRNLSINTHDQSLSNAGSRSASTGPVLGLIAGKQLDITSGTVDNRAGLISAQNALNITSSGNLNNAANNGHVSQIYSGSDLTVQTTGLDNTASQILAVGNASLQAGDGRISNSAGLVRVGQTLTLQAASVDNSSTRAFNADGTPKPLGLEGANIVMTTAKLNNTQGAVRAAQDLSVFSDGQLTNDQGELSAGRKLQISTAQASTPSLSIHNQSGLIVADQSVTVRTGSLSGAGTLASKGDVSLSLQGDHTLAGTLQAGGNLSLSATGQITNPISVQAGKNLSITAGKLDNQATGELLSAKTTTLSIADTLTNRGLIDGADTRIQAGTVNNLGTGRIYGDRVAIAADTLTNQEETLSGVTKAATIAGRERVDVGVQTLINQENALIYSGGDLAMGGALNASWQATGTARALSNKSATIEAAQNLSIQANNIQNTNEHFASAVQQTGQAGITEYQHAPGDTTSASDNSTRFVPADVSITDCQALCMTTVAGTSDAFVRYDYTRTVEESVVTQSAPGKILAGGGITLRATSVLNDKSQIVAGGTLDVQASSLNNVQGQGSKTTADVGTTTSYWRIRKKGTDTYGSSTSDYAPAATQETTVLSVTRYEQNTANASTGAAPSGSSLSAVQAQATATGAVGTASPSASLSTVAGTQAGAATGTATASQTNAKAQVANASAAQAAGTSAPQSTSAKSGSALTQVKTLQPNYQIPNTSLYRQHPESGAKYLVETDPQFANYKTWLGSDYMLSALNLNPATTQKRLGDGFYEQKLIREQVMALTGNRFLGDYRSDEEEYMALMNSGLTYARQWNLRPGIALNADQIAQLTSDMVWLVTQEVTLPDGSKQSVLVPQVYVRVKPGDLDGSGALLAGKDVRLNLSGDATNSGTIAGRNLVQISAQNIQNMGGQISADTLALQAQEDINNVGGTLQAQSAALLSAGRDLNITSTTQSSASQAGANSFAQTGIDRVAGLYVKGSTGTLLASAGRDLNLTAAAVGNAGTGPTVLAAGNNLNLNTVTTSNSQDINWSGVNYLRQSQSQDVGSQINAGGALSLSAGNDLNAKAASVNAGQALNVSAGNNVNITAGQASQSLDTANTVTSNGTLSSRTLSTRETSQSTTAVGSTFEGNSVNVSAGKDLSVNGSNVLADQNVQLNAGGNVNITAAQNTQSSSNFSQTTTSGVMSGGGIGVTVGSRMQSVDQQGQSTTAAGSTIGSTGGNVTINAGKTYTQTGSDVLTPAGDIAITAQKVDINEARETGSQSTEQKFKQSGVSVGLTGGMIDTLQATTQAVQGAANSTSNRNKVLNALVFWGKGADLYEQGTAVANIAAKSDASSAAAASGIKVSISAGSSNSQSNSNTTYDSSAGSTVKAGGNVSIKATEGDLTVQGSNVQAEKDLALSAAKNVNILASADTEENRSNNKSSSTSVGVSFGVGAGSAGLSLDVAASRGKGQANSDSTTYNNSHVSAGNQVSISSGADTNVKGGNITGQQVTAIVGGNLNVESLQDKATSNASQSTTGVAVSIPIGAGTGSASISQSKQRSDSNYQSTGEQSGISAGDGGFQINVKNNTDLKGAVIASNASADKNSLSTGTLTTSDLNNTMSASASSSGTTLGTNMLSGKYELGKAVVGNLLNNGSAGQSDASTTKTAISAAQVTVNGKTTDTSKEALTDSNGKAVSSDTNATNRTLAKADVAGLQQQAQQKQADNMLMFKAAVAIADDGLKKMTKPQLLQVFCVAEPCSNDQAANTAKIGVIAQGLMKENPGLTSDQATTLAIAAIVGKDGDPAKADPQYSGSDPNRFVKPIGQDAEIRNIQTVPVTVGDLQNLSNDQKVNSTVFANGIFNSEQRAAELAVQQTPKLDPNDPAQRQQIQNTGTVLQGNTYLVSTDKSNNSLGEFVTAGVEKLAEILGVATPAAQLKAQTIQALSTNNATGQTDNPVNSVGHSRGTMTDVDTYNALGSKGFYNPNLKVMENNPAAAQERIEQSASKVTDPANVQIFAPRNDPVATFVGGYGQGNKLEALKEVPAMATTSNSVHSSPGSGAVGSNSLDVNKAFSYQGLDVNQLNQAKQPQTDAILEQVQANPKPISITPSTDQATKLQDQVGKDSNAQMNQLLNPSSAASIPAPVVPAASGARINQLQKFKQEGK